MSLTVLQKKIVNGVWSFFSYKIFKNQSKQCNLLFAFTTVKRMLSLLGQLLAIGYSSCQGTSLSDPAFLCLQLLLTPTLVCNFSIRNATQKCEKVKNSSPKKLSADCWPTVGRLSANCRLALFTKIFCRQSADCWSFVGRLLAACR